MYGKFKDSETVARVLYDDFFPPLSVQVKVDANNHPDIKFVLHELLHVVFADILRARVDDSVEEVVIVALTEDLYSFVKSSPTRHLAWQGLIEHKLAKTSPPEVTSDESSGTGRVPSDLDT